MNPLHRYLIRLQSTILSRQEIEVEVMEIFDRSDRVGQTSEFYAQLRFYDGSQLYVVEKLIVERYSIIKARYSYQYQQTNGNLIFRYDNVPHHPDIESYPHHKHIQNKVVAAQPPDLSEVLHEIDGILYKGESA